MSSYVNLNLTQPLSFRIVFSSSQHNLMSHDDVSVQNALWHNWLINIIIIIIIILQLVLSFYLYPYHHLVFPFVAIVLILS